MRYILRISKQQIKQMSKFLKRNRQEIKNKIYSKLNLTSQQAEQSTIRQSFEFEETDKQISKLLRQTQKKKLSIREQLTKNSAIDYSEQMIQLKWRIEALRNNSIKSSKIALSNPRSQSLTGKQQQFPERQMTFDELYDIQKKKYSVLRERRKQKMNDPKYIQMIGNMHLRKQKRKMNLSSRIDDHFRLLDEKITQHND